MVVVMFRSRANVVVIMFVWFRLQFIEDFSHGYKGNHNNGLLDLVSKLAKAR